jgi:hypothetical protein
MCHQSALGLLAASAYFMAGVSTIARHFGKQITRFNMLGPAHLGNGS